MTYALRRVCSLPTHALAAPMEPIIALTAHAALVLPDAPFHEPFYAPAPRPRAQPPTPQHAGHYRTPEALAGQSGNLPHLRAAGRDLRRTSGSAGRCQQASWRPRPSRSPRGVRRGRWWSASRPTSSRSTVRAAAPPISALAKCRALGARPRVFLRSPGKPHAEGLPRRCRAKSFASPPPEWQGIGRDGQRPKTQRLETQSIHT